MSRTGNCFSRFPSARAGTGQDFYLPKLFNSFDFSCPLSGARGLAGSSGANPSRSPKTQRNKGKTDEVGNRVAIWMPEKQ